jgi:hypothetical protein
MHPLPGTGPRVLQLASQLRGHAQPLPLPLQLLLQRCRTTGLLPLAPGTRQVHPVVVNQGLRPGHRGHPHGEASRRNGAAGHRNGGTTNPSRRRTSELGVAGHLAGLVATPRLTTTILPPDSIWFCTSSCSHKDFIVSSSHRAARATGTLLVHTSG